MLHSLYNGVKYQSLPKKLHFCPSLSYEQKHIKLNQNEGAYGYFRGCKLDILCSNNGMVCSARISFSKKSKAV